MPFTRQATGEVIAAEDINELQVAIEALQSSGSGLYTAYICIKDEKAAGTDGGTFTSGAYRTRDLNTEAADTGNHASIATNQITLAAGTYTVRAQAPATNVGRHQARLQNITAAATILSGTSEVMGTTTTVNSHSWIVGTFTLTVDSVLEIQHICQASGTFGTGSAGFYTPAIETYTVVELFRRA